MTHTPGPWFVASNADDGGVASTFGRMRDIGNDEAECIMGGGDDYRHADPEIAPGPRIICWTQMSDTAEGGEAITDEDRANASLIAAAPALYDAARVAVSFLQDNYRDLVDGVPMYATMPEWIELKAAISAAEGRIE